MTDDPELLRLTEELRRIDRPRPPFPYITKPAKMREWTATVLTPWKLANPEAEEEYHRVKAEAVRRSDAVEALGIEAAKREQARAYVERWAGELTALALDTGKPTPALDAAKAWWPSDSWCLVLTGDPGVGKTVGAAWAARESWVKSGNVRWVSVNEASLERLFGPEAERLRMAAKNADMLVLDDVGKDNNSDVWKAWLEAVLDARWRDGRRTVLTTNLSARPDTNLRGETLKAPLEVRLGLRLWDRLAQGGKLVACGNVSLRRTPQRRAS